MAKDRIDKMLVDQGLAESRAKAQAMIMAGSVLVDEKRVEKASESFAAESVIRIKGQGPESRYVSRGGLKLEAALARFEISPDGFVCLDVGSSTGGFTDCLLQHGAASVVALDVGTNQLVWKLRTDPRVDVRENVNARSLRRADFDEAFDLIVMDVSFISATKILGSLIELLKDGREIVLLIKPQFEVGKGEVGKGGIVRDPDKHARVVSDVNSFATDLGLELIGTIESPIEGAEGNKEFLACYRKPVQQQLVDSPADFIENVHYYFENGLMVLTEKFLLARGYCCGTGCRHCPYDGERKLTSQ